MLYELPLDIQRSLSGKFIYEKVQKPRNEEELYDLKKDPNEKNNLVKEINFQEIKIELKKKLFDWMKNTSDPLLKGRVKPQNDVTHGNGRI